MYSSMEILVFAAKWHVKGSTREEQGRFDDGADRRELAELPTGAAAPERTAGPDGFRASSIACDLNGRWTFAAADAADSGVFGRHYRHSVSDVVEDEAQSAPCFVCGKAYATNRLGLPAMWFCMRARSNIVLVDGYEGWRIAWCGIRCCVRLAAVLLVFL
jgi:hypothetical protein